MRRLVRVSFLKKDSLFNAQRNRAFSQKLGQFRGWHLAEIYLVHEGKMKRSGM